MTQLLPGDPRLDVREKMDSAHGRPAWPTDGGGRRSTGERTAADAAEYPKPAPRTVQEDPRYSQTASAEVDDREQRQAAQAARAAGVDIRLQALDRIRLMSTNLALHAWRQRFSDPLAPHSLGFLFVHPDPLRDAGWLVTAAWRNWVEHPDVRSLPHLLNTLCRKWSVQPGDGMLDIRADLADGCDAQPAGLQVLYVGLAVISLDTRAWTWEQARTAARTAADIPAEIRIVLNDTTVMIGQQLGRSQFGDFHVQSSQPLEYGWQRPHYPHKVVHADDLYADERHRDILRWATALSRELHRADQYRLAALRGHAARTRSAQPAPPPTHHGQQAGHRA